MIDGVVRSATAADTAAVQALCKLLDPADYVPDAWPIWLNVANAVNLLADVGGRVVGCLHGELLTPQEAWAQAMRVHYDRNLVRASKQPQAPRRPEVQRRTIASQLLTALEAELRRRRAQVLRGTIDVSNRASLALVRNAAWRIVARVCRRRAAGRIGHAEGALRATSAEARALVRAAPVLVSRPHLALVKRAYFAMTDEHVVGLVRRGAVVVSQDRQAYAILDPDAAQSSGALWVVAIAGNPASRREVLEDLVKEAGSSGLGVVVDSPAEPVLQSALDAMGFKTPERYGEFVVVEHWL
jgi:hypothetical protein